MRYAMWTALLGALLLASACGGAGTNVRGGLDPETGAATGEADEAPVRARRQQARAVHPAEIPLLTLEGVVPEAPPAPAEAGGQPGAQGSPEGALANGQPSGPSPRQAQPGVRVYGPPVPPGLAAGAKPPGASQPRPPSETALALPPRNLFGFEEDPAVVAERQRLAQEAAQKAAEAAEKAAEARRRWQGPPQPPPPPQPPAIPFQFIGYLGPPNDRTAVLSQGGQIIMAKKNDVVLNQFRIVDIGYESAEIGFTGFKETQRVPLSGGGK